VSQLLVARRLHSCELFPEHRELTCRDLKHFLEGERMRGLGFRRPCFGNQFVSVGWSLTSVFPLQTFGSVVESGGRSVVNLWEDD
jgi:hypothetical protein